MELLKLKLNKWIKIISVHKNRFLAYLPFIPLLSRHKFLMNDFAPFSKFNKIIFEIVLLYRPETVVELGTGEGNCMSLVGIALKTNKKGKLFSFDYYKERIEGFVPKTGKSVERKKAILGIDRFIENFQTDVFTYSWSGKPIDVLIVDIDNTYERLINIKENWFGKLSDNGLVLIEGGYSQYNNKSRGISKFCQYMRNNNWETFTLLHYPGLVIVKKIHDDHNSF